MFLATLGGMFLGQKSLHLTILNTSSMNENIIPPSLPEKLFVRLSTDRVCLARYDAHGQGGFAFSTYRLDSKTPLAVNLKEMTRTEELLNAPGRGGTQVILGTPATFVPLAEFQEQNCETLYDYCFPKEEPRRIFYDVAGAANCVVIFSLKETVCRILEDTFETPNFISTHTPLIRHFAAKGTGNTEGKRVFVNVRQSNTDLYAFENSRLIFANSFPTESAIDTVYYTLAAAEQLGMNVSRNSENEDAETLVKSCPFCVSGEETYRRKVCEELGKYVGNILSVNPKAEFNRHAVACTPHVPYDMMTLLLDNK